MGIDTEVIDKLLVGYKRPEEIVGENGLLKQLTKAILERALNAEMTEHLGYEKHDPVGYKSGNARNGKSRKTIKGEFGEVELETPRDRAGTFQPALFARYQRSEQALVLALAEMYLQGVSTRKVKAVTEALQTKMNLAGVYRVEPLALLLAAPEIGRE